MFALIVVLSRLTIDIKESIESARMPVPLFFPDLRMVSQIFPGRCSSWLLIDRSGC